MAGEFSPQMERAVALIHAGRVEEAVTECREYLRLFPGSPIACQLLGVVAFRAGDYQTAIDRFSEVVRGDPTNADALNNLGQVLCHAGCPTEAIEWLDKAILVSPNNPHAFCNLSRALAGVGRMEDALEAGKRAVALDPQFPEAYLNVGTVLFECGAVREAIDTYGHVLSLRSGDHLAWSNYLMALQYSSEHSAKDLFEAALAWGRSMPGPLPWRRPDEDGARRLKIGYVSGDFRAHSVGFAMEPILRGHDRSRVEIFCYSNSPIEDDHTATLRGLSDHWRAILAVDDRNAAELVHADGIDVLVDLSGHTFHNRLGVFALKPVPVQATWLGYFGTTGLSQIDFILRDQPQVPSAEHSNYVEGVWPLTDAAYGFDAGPEAPEVSPLPAVRNGHVTFGCFNNLAKVSGRCIQAWAAVLHAVPGSVLMLNRKPLGDPSVQRLFARAFATHGIGENRLRMGASKGRADYFRLYEEVDIMLDTFPFNGGTTTYEALWMGVPVISHRWDRMVGHFGESILVPCGHPEWVARKESDLIRIAVGLASDVRRLEVLRRGLREELAHSRLCRAGDCANGLEDAYFGMWDQRSRTAQGAAA
jgi:predicted O-linked N-acetylglucosamine transferase (SPINDLY family)